MTNKVKAALASAIMAFSVLSTSVSDFTGFNNDSSVTVSAATYNKRLYDQNTWPTIELRKTGCGIFSLANAVYCLNGSKIDVEKVASWAADKKAWTYAYGLNRYKFYSDKSVAKKFGAEYNFKIDDSMDGTVKSEALKNHLSDGGVAVAHVDNHFIVLSDYDPAKGFFVIESAVDKIRNLPAIGWVSASKLSSGLTYVDWFCLISKASPSQPGNTSAYFPKYTGSSGSISTALTSLGYDGSYEYRSKIASANNIKGYSGSSAQNTQMLEMLKAGTLKKPSGSSSVTYFPKYTGSSGSISTALTSLGYDGSYTYRTKIAAANNIKGYSGTSAENTKMLDMLKSGTLVKP